MAISGTAISLFSPAVQALRAEQRHGAAAPPVVPLKPAGTRPAPQREKVLEGELLGQPFRADNSTETIFSRAYVEGSFNYQASGGVFQDVRSGRQAVASYSENATVHSLLDDNPRQLVDFFV